MGNLQFLNCICFKLIISLWPLKKTHNLAPTQLLYLLFLWSFLALLAPNFYFTSPWHFTTSKVLSACAQFLDSGAVSCLYNQIMFSILNANEYIYFNDRFHTFNLQNFIVWIIVIFQNILGFSFYEWCHIKEIKKIADKVFCTKNCWLFIWLFHIKAGFKVINFERVLVCIWTA